MILNLLFSADAGEGIEQNSVSMALEGADGATSVVGSTMHTELVLVLIH